METNLGKSSVLPPMPRHAPRGVPAVRRRERALRGDDEGAAASVEGPDALGAQVRGVGPSAKSELWSVTHSPHTRLLARLSSL